MLLKTQSWKSCLSALTSPDFWSSASCLTDRLPQHASVHKWPCGQQRLASSGQGSFAADDTCLLVCIHAHAMTPVLRHTLCQVNAFSKTCRIKMYSLSSLCSYLSQYILSLSSSNYHSPHNKVPSNLNVHTSSDPLYVQVAYNKFLFSLLERGPQALHCPFSWGSWGSPPLWWTGLQDCPTTHRHAHFMHLCLTSCNLGGAGQIQQHC